MNQLLLPARRHAAALYRLALVGFDEQIGTADELVSFGHRIGAAVALARRLFGNTWADRLLDDVNARLTCELLE